MDPPHAIDTPTCSPINMVLQGTNVTPFRRDIYSL